MHGQAYLTSSEHAEHVGPFEGFALNREPMLRVMEMHRGAVEAIDPAMVPANLIDEARSCLDRVRRVGPQARLPQQPGDGARAHRHHRLHDGLRHHGRRARHRAGEVQAARRRRHAQDRQPHRADGAADPRLRRADDRRRARLRRRQGHDRGRPGHQGRRPRRLRLRLHAPGRLAVDRLARPRQDDVGRPAVPLGGDLEDDQHAPRVHSGRHPRGVPRRLEARPEGGRDLPRRLQGVAAREHHHRGEGRREQAGRRQRPSPPPIAAAAPRIAAPVGRRPAPPPSPPRPTSRGASACPTPARA